MANRAEKHPPFTPEQKQKGGWMSAKMRKWRAENPDAPPTRSERKRMLRELFSELTPPAVDAVKAIVEDEKHPDHADLIKFVIQQDLGRAMQAVELTGQDGKPVEIQEIRRVIVNPGDKDPEDI